jgi:predicted DNA-binding protein
VSDKPRRKSQEIKFRVEPEIHDAFDRLCDRVNQTKSDILREYIGFLLDHPELEIRREMLEEMLAAYKATSLAKNENVH